MQNRNTLYIVLGAGVIAVIALGIYLQERPRQAPADTGEAAATTTTEGDITVLGSGDYTITEQPADAGPAAPDYNAPVVFSAAVSADVRAAVNASLAKTRALLVKSAENAGAWLQLGALYEIAGDYPHAALMWNYVSAHWPTNTVSFNNLGDLYMNDLKDYVKAEANYLQEIRNAPTNTNSYRVLFSLYTDYGYKKGTSAAEDILKKGIAANPGAYDLEVMLARYYKTLGRTADARVQYDAAIRGAQAAGQTAAVEQLKAEMAALPQ